MSDNRKRATEIAEEFLARPVVMADELFDIYDEDASNALDDIVALVASYQLLRITPTNPPAAWPKCILKDGTGAGEGLPLVERHYITAELKELTHELRLLVRISGRRLRSRVKELADKETAAQ